ncbi:MAG: nitronate monooxygenase, partial [Betaproteobacteria bacterium]|nr:nitronate monooxygenase [Betaproteobacteria bacterium]
SQIFDMGNIPASTSVLKARPISQVSQAPWVPCPIDQVVAAILAEKPAVVFAPHVETSAGMILPDDYLKKVTDAVHSYGGMVLHDVIDQFFAHKAIEKGADGLILVASGAGGHAGRQSPFALVAETRRWFDGPIALSGSIASGAGVLAAQAMGADFAYIGSAFIATQEANAKDAYKQAIVEGSAKDIVYTNLFTGVHGNYLRSSIEQAGLDPDQLPESDPSAMNFNSGGNMDKKAWKDIWGCGQGIGTVDQVLSAGELVDKLAHEYQLATQAMTRQTEQQSA